MAFSTVTSVIPFWRINSYKCEFKLDLPLLWSNLCARLPRKQWPLIQLSFLQILWAFLTFVQWNTSPSALTRQSAYSVAKLRRFVVGGRRNHWRLVDRTRSGSGSWSSAFNIHHCWSDHRQTRYLTIRNDSQVDCRGLVCLTSLQFSLMSNPKRTDLCSRIQVRWRRAWSDWEGWARRSGAILCDRLRSFALRGCRS